MIEPSPYLPAKLLPYFEQMASAYQFEQRSTLWLEVLCGVLWKRDHQPEKFTDETAELLAEMTRDLPPRR